MTSQETPLPLQELTLEQRYLQTHPNGTLQNRAQGFEAHLGNSNGLPLLKEARKPGRHLIELLKDMIEQGLPFTSDPLKAAPIFGQASKMGRQGTVISPSFASAVKISKN